MDLLKCLDGRVKEFVDATSGVIEVTHIGQSPLAQAVTIFFHAKHVWVPSMLQNQGASLVQFLGNEVAASYPVGSRVHLSASPVTSSYFTLGATCVWPVGHDVPSKPSTDSESRLETLMMDFERNPPSLVQATFPKFPQQGTLEGKARVVSILDDDFGLIQLTGSDVQFKFFALFHKSQVWTRDHRHISDIVGLCQDQIPLRKIVKEGQEVCLSARSIICSHGFHLKSAVVELQAVVVSLDPNCIPDTAPMPTMLEQGTGAFGLGESPTWYFFGRHSQQDLNALLQIYLVRHKKDLPDLDPRCKVQDDARHREQSVMTQREPFNTFQDSSMAMQGYLLEEQLPERGSASEQTPRQKNDRFSMSPHSRGNDGKPFRSRSRSRRQSSSSSISPKRFKNQTSPYSSLTFGSKSPKRIPRRATYYSRSPEHNITHVRHFRSKSRSRSSSASPRRLKNQTRTYSRSHSRSRSPKRVLRRATYYSRSPEHNITHVRHSRSKSRSRSSSASPRRLKNQTRTYSRSHSRSRSPKKMVRRATRYSRSPDHYKKYVHHSHSKSRSRSLSPKRFKNQIEYSHLHSRNKSPKRVPRVARSPFSKTHVRYLHSKSRSKSSSISYQGHRTNNMSESGLRNERSGLSKGYSRSPDISRSHWRSRSPSPERDSRFQNDRTNKDHIFISQQISPKTNKIPDCHTSKTESNYQPNNPFSPFSECVPTKSDSDLLNGAQLETSIVASPNATRPSTNSFTDLRQIINMKSVNKQTSFEAISSDIVTSQALHSSFPTDSMELQASQNSDEHQSLVTNYKFGAYLTPKEIKKWLNTKIIVSDNFSKGANVKRTHSCAKISKNTIKLFFRSCTSYGFFSLFAKNGTVVLGSPDGTVLVFHNFIKEHIHPRIKSLLQDAGIIKVLANKMDVLSQLPKKWQPVTNVLDAQCIWKMWVNVEMVDEALPQYLGLKSQSNLDQACIESSNIVDGRQIKAMAQTVQYPTLGLLKVALEYCQRMHRNKDLNPVPIVLQICYSFAGQDINLADFNGPFQNPSFLDPSSAFLPPLGTNSDVLGNNVLEVYRLIDSSKFVCLASDYCLPRGLNPDKKLKYVKKINWSAILLSEIKSSTEPNAGFYIDVCQSCGDWHEKSKSFYPCLFLKFSCLYPLCKDIKTHCTAVCPFLHGMCSLCCRRGHIVDDHQMLNPMDLDYVFLIWAPHGILTSVPLLEKTNLFKYCKDYFWEFSLYGKDRNSSKRLLAIYNIPFSEAAQPPPYPSKTIKPICSQPSSMKNFSFADFVDSSKFEKLRQSDGDLKTDATPVETSDGELKTDATPVVTSDGDLTIDSTPVVTLKAIYKSPFSKATPTPDSSKTTKASCSRPSSNKNFSFANFVDSSKFENLQQSDGDLKTDAAAVETSDGELKTDAAPVEPSVGELKTDVTPVETSDGELKTDSTPVVTLEAIYKSPFSKATPTPDPSKTTKAFCSRPSSNKNFSFANFIDSSNFETVQKLLPSDGCLKTDATPVKTSDDDLKTDATPVATSDGGLKTDATPVVTLETAKVWIAERTFLSDALPEMANASLCYEINGTYNGLTLPSSCIQQFVNTCYSCGFFSVCFYEKDGDWISLGNPRGVVLIFSNISKEDLPKEIVSLLQDPGIFKVVYGQYTIDKLLQKGFVNFNNILEIRLVLREWDKRKFRDSFKRKMDIIVYRVRKPLQELYKVAVQYSKRTQRPENCNVLPLVLQVCYSLSGKVLKTLSCKDSDPSQVHLPPKDEDLSRNNILETYKLIDINTSNVLVKDYPLPAGFEPCHELDHFTSGDLSKPVHILWTPESLSELGLSCDADPEVILSLHQNCKQIQENSLDLHPCQCMEITCAYPLCKDKSSHCISVCPHLHGRCSHCERRGHIADDHKKLNPMDLDYLFLIWAPNGILTSLPFLELTHLAEHCKENFWEFSLYGKDRESSKRLLKLYNIPHSRPDEKSY